MKRGKTYGNGGISLKWKTQHHSHNSDLCDPKQPRICLRSFRNKIIDNKTEQHQINPAQHRHVGMGVR